jgi:hypothetical protein
MKNVSKYGKAKEEIWKLKWQGHNVTHTTCIMEFVRVSSIKLMCLVRVSFIKLMCLVNGLPFSKWGEE